MNQKSSQKKVSPDVSQPHQPPKDSSSTKARVEGEPYSNDSIPKIALESSKLPTPTSYHQSGPVITPVTATFEGEPPLDGSILKGTLQSSQPSSPWFQGNPTRLVPIPPVPSDPLHLLNSSTQQLRGNHLFQEQSIEVSVIVEYLQKYPLAYALLTYSPTPQSLFSDVFQSVAISPRAKSKHLDVEFDLFLANLVLTKEEFAISLGLSNGSRKPTTFFTPSSAQLLTMFKGMGYKFEENSKLNLSRNRKACLPTPWHFLNSILTRCIFGSVGGRTHGKTDLWIVMYGLFYDINVAYASLIWEDVLTFLPASKNKFLIHHPCGWSIIIHDVINNSNLTPKGIPEGPLPKFLQEALRSCNQEVGLKKKRANSDQPPLVPSLAVSNDNLGVDLDEPTFPLKTGTTSKPLSFLDSLFQAPSDYVEPSSLALVSPAGFQSVLESPRNHVSLDYDSLEDDDQDSVKKSELEDLPKSFPVQDNQDEDTPMQTVDIPSSEGLIVDDEPHDMSIVLYSKPSTRTFNIDLNDYSPSPHKESQEHDDIQEAKFSYFPPDPPQDDDTPADTNKANTSEPEPEHNVCILFETTEAQVKKLRSPLKTLMAQLHISWEKLFSHIKAQDQYISTLETSVAELSKGLASSSMSPFQAFREQVQCQLDSLQSDIANLSKCNSQKENNSSGEIYSLQKTVHLVVNEVKDIKTQSSSSDIRKLQKKVASTESK
ncbi:unnamed protein product [Lactuca virosa]|uniref:Aminotransferase-like plant mobile domain-containing protein n=1 Tax=Lactuca virosa TaxID=75947 RepID=A0AAU9PNM2_9ASTR|nr:unnamed protein product [Lactuca virosa]